MLGFGIMAGVGFRDGGRDHVSDRGSRVGFRGVDGNGFRDGVLFSF